MRRVHSALTIVAIMMPGCRSTTVPVEAYPEDETVMLSPPEGPIEHFIPWFADPQPLLLQDSIVSQCWTRGAPLLYPGARGPIDLRTMDSCICWRVYGVLHRNLRGGYTYVPEEDSSLLAKWQLGPDGVMEYQCVDKPDKRRFRMDALDTVREVTEYIDHLDGTGSEVFHTVWFRATEIP